MYKQCMNNVKQCLNSALSPKGETRAIEKKKKRKKRRREKRKRGKRRCAGNNLYPNPA